MQRASVCIMGDVARRLHCRILSRQLCLCTRQQQQIRWVSATTSGIAQARDCRLVKYGDANSYLVTKQSLPRCLCTNALAVNAVGAVSAKEGSRSKRRKGLKTPGSDKYAALKVAKQAAATTYTSSIPVPSKARAEPDDDETTLICPGCGVYMQDSDPQAPGYFQLPANFESEPGKEGAEEIVAAADEVEQEGEEQDDGVKEVEQEPKKEGDESNEDYEFFEIVKGQVNKLDTHEFTSPSNFNKADVKHLDDTWDFVIEGAKEKEKERKERNALKLIKREKHDDDKLVVCARCHSLRYYGRVKEKTAENLLPDFDFDKMVGKRLKTAYGRRAVVVMVVDAVDFDGSFPRRVARLLSEVETQMAASWKEGVSGNSPQLIVVATKIDLLPGQVSPARLEQWIRKRTIMGGAPRPTAVHLLSSTKGWGVQALTERIMQLAGPRGDVWVVGAQNAGKSSLINALARFNVGRQESKRLTEAAHPGTTIGILKIAGLLPANVKLYDTPGILHPHQLTMRLNEEEFKMVQIRKELRARTYRVKVGHSIHIGGLLRLDLVEAPAQTIYMNVWASPLISLHMGKTERADELLVKHIGNQLEPPMSMDRWHELGNWICQTVRVSGDTWEASSVDIVAAGLGWVGLGLKGEAVISVWTFEGVALSTREAMVYDYARIFEKPGFTVIKSTLEKEKPEKTSNAETSFNRRKDRERKEKMKLKSVASSPEAEVQDVVTPAVA